MIIKPHINTCCKKKNIFLLQQNITFLLNEHVIDTSAHNASENINTNSKCILILIFKNNCGSSAESTKTRKWMKQQHGVNVSYWYQPDDRCTPKSDQTEAMTTTKLDINRTVRNLHC